MDIVPHSRVFHCCTLRRGHAIEVLVVALVSSAEEKGIIRSFPVHDVMSSLCAIALCVVLGFALCFDCCLFIEKVCFLLWRKMLCKPY